MPKHVEWQSRFLMLASQSQDLRLREYYQTPMPSADSLVSELEFVAIDLETTGLEAQGNDIVSIGLVPFNERRIRLKEAKHWIVRPQSKLAEESVVIHGITHGAVAQAPRFEEVAGELLAALAGKVLVAHYHVIERTFLHQAFLQQLGQALECPYVCTMDIERRALKQRQGLLGRLLREKIGSLRLADSRKRYHLPLYHGHHALTDALACAELFQAQLRYHYRNDTQIQQLWL